MIKHEFMPLIGVLMIRPTAPLSSADFQELAREVDGYIETHGKLRGLMIEADAFPGWENFGALVSHLRFVREHHRFIRRIAAVSDSKILTILPKIAAHFVGAEVRHFSASDRESALHWIAEEPAVAEVPDRGE